MSRSLKVDDDVFYMQSFQTSYLYHFHSYSKEMDLKVFVEVVFLIWRISNFFFKKYCFDFECIGHHSSMRSRVLWALTQKGSFIIDTLLF